MISKGLSSESKEVFSNRLLEWWEKNKRDFSWRYTKDSYAVLIAEMLLRKTTAIQVERIYNLFISKYSCPEALSNADESEIKDLLKPLGMEYCRATLFIKLGKALVERYKGNIPAKAEELFQLPGVGLYATNAVLSFSYGQDVPMVDTNLVRLIKRVFNFKSSKVRARNDSKLLEFAYSLMPVGRSKEFNLAILDFAGTICKSRNPKCNICPLVSICTFFKGKERNEKI